MKKLVLTTLAACAFTAAAFAQGTISWSGVGGGLIVQTNGTVYSTFGVTQGAANGTQGTTFGNTAANNAALGYQGYYYELLAAANGTAAPTTVANLSAWSDTTLSSTNSNSASNNGRTTQVAANTAAVASHMPTGVTNAIILVGWSANLGNTWNAALLALQTQSWALLATPAYFGVSTVGEIAAHAGNPGANVFGGGNTADGTPINNSAINSPPGTPEQLDVLGVPEPGTLALAALGGASLLLFRRKK